MFGTRGSFPTELTVDGVFYDTNNVKTPIPAVLYDNSQGIDINIFQSSIYHQFCTLLSKHFPLGKSRINRLSTLDGGVSDHKRHVFEIAGKDGKFVSSLIPNREPIPLLGPLPFEDGEEKPKVVSSRKSKATSSGDKSSKPKLVPFSYADWYESDYSKLKAALVTSTTKYFECFVKGIEPSTLGMTQVFFPIIDKIARQALVNLQKYPPSSVDTCCQASVVEAQLAMCMKSLCCVVTGRSTAPPVKFSMISIPSPDGSSVVNVTLVRSTKDPFDASYVESISGITTLSDDAFTKLSIPKLSLVPVVSTLANPCFKRQKTHDAEK
jgi:hypothetical protein